MAQNLKTRKKSHRRRYFYPASCLAAPLLLFSSQIHFTNSFTTRSPPIKKSLITHPTSSPSTSSLHATSSDHLKSSSSNEQKEQKKPKNAKVIKWGTRLAKAAAAASATKKIDDSSPSSLTTPALKNNSVRFPKNGKSRSPQPPTNSSNIGSVSELTKVLDSKLYSQSPRNFYNSQSYNPSLNGLVQHSRDSTPSMLGYKVVDSDISQKNRISTRQVAVVFGKRLVKDQITVEYVARLNALLRVLQQNNIDETTNGATAGIGSDGGKHQPISLVYFCGEGVSEGNCIPDATAGYIYFRQLCEMKGIDISNIKFVVDETSRDEGEALKKLTEVIKSRYLMRWLESSLAVVQQSSSSNFPLSTVKKLNVHVTLISTEYHLCNLNDVYHRSPRLSALTTLEEWERRTNADGLYCDYGQEVGHATVKGTLETSWSFFYATYPFMSTRDDVLLFLGKCYLLAEELVPLLVNMKGVVDQVEFFQRDNYPLLSSIRRSLVTHVESLHSRPHNPLLAKLKSTPHRPAAYSVEQTLESALLSVGRCIDLIRPAGFVQGTVCRTDWERALSSLQRCVDGIRRDCDPDRPLTLKEWMEFTEGWGDESDYGVEEGWRERNGVEKNDS